MRDDLMALEMEVEKMNPRFHLSEDILKAVKGWETGKKYKVELEIRQIGKHEELDEPVSARFEILKAKTVDKKESDARLMEEGDSKEFTNVVV